MAETEGGESPFLSLPEGIDIAHYFVEETEHRNPGCNGISLWREGTDYCYLWVEAFVDLDMWHAYLLDVRTAVDVRPGEFGETRDYLYVFHGAGDRFDVEWHQHPINPFTEPSEKNWERFESGMKFLAARIEKSVEDYHEEAHRA